MIMGFDNEQQGTMDTPPPLYTFHCKCGAAHEARLTEAGTRRDCGCGKSIVVPSNVALKAMAGEDALSADFEIEKRYDAGELPLEPDCCQCFRPTDGVLKIRAECERQKIKKEYNSRTGCALFLVAGVWGVIINRMLASDERNAKVVGRDVILIMPVRCCDACRRDLRTAAAGQKALERTPLYRRLLQKYPHARLSW
jgi:hypothetical protein